jgi:hypothetical protein
MAGLVLRMETNQSNTMKFLSSLTSLLVLPTLFVLGIHGVCQAGPQKAPLAAPEAAEEDLSLEDVVELIPKEVFKQFKRPGEIESARRSANDILLEKAVGKTVTGEVELGERSAWAGDGSADKFQVAIEEIEMEEGGVEFTVRLWVFLPIDDEGKLNDLESGEEVEVTGKLTRFEFTTTGSELYLSGDLRGARITDD